jgi:alkylated DNA repair dioxygenase AlkB
MLTLGFVTKPSFEYIHSELLDLAWETKRTARHEYFMSDKKISYSYGNNINYESKPMTYWVKGIMETLNRVHSIKLNACFLNKYDDEHQHLGWHADDFDGMDQSQPIAVVSFGAEREIWTKLKDFKGEIPEEWKYLLKQGSLFMMPVGFQDTHYHRIPKHSCPCGWRISLTYRSFKD